MTALNAPDSVWPSIYVQPFIVSHPKGEILVCQIASSSQVHQYKEKIYVRENESDIGGDWFGRSKYEPLSAAL